MASLPSSAGEFATNRVRELGLVLAAFFVVVVIVAGGAAMALLIWPSHSGTYFSWDLGEAPAAALIGGLYLASVAVFADAAARPRSQSRSLTFGVLGLAGPTLLFTLVHRDVFDWTRPQALAWVVLFCSAPISILLDLRQHVDVDDSPKASRGVRSVIFTVSVTAAMLAAGLWTPSIQDWLAARSPIPLVGLTAAYLGAWCSFVAVASCIAAVRGRASDVRTVAILLGSVSIGAAIASMRTAGDLQAGSGVYVLGLAALMLTAIGLIVCARGSWTLDSAKPATTQRQRGDNRSPST